jgi:hypothetical protein
LLHPPASDGNSYAPPVGGPLFAPPASKGIGPQPISVGFFCFCFFFLFFVIISEGFSGLVLFFLLVFSRFCWAIFELLKFKSIQLKIV